MLQALSATATRAATAAAVAVEYMYLATARSRTASTEAMRLRWHQVHPREPYTGRPVRCSAATRPGCGLAPGALRARRGLLRWSCAGFLCARDAAHGRCRAQHGSARRRRSPAARSHTRVSPVPSRGPSRNRGTQSGASSAPSSSRAEGAAGPRPQNPAAPGWQRTGVRRPARVRPERGPRNSVAAAVQALAPRVLGCSRCRRWPLCARRQGRWRGQSSLGRCRAPRTARRGEGLRGSRLHASGPGYLRMSSEEEALSLAPFSANGTLILSRTKEPRPALH